ncbi:BACON domain-containing protein, partial [Streptomyces sp. b94]|uniref:BACON domain-containing protein n=1 Tax=Streptomyces sp. b94 TaxID=1827634 RepID=UPI00117FD5E3
TAAGPWPGAAPVAALPLVDAPRPSVYVAMAQAQRARVAGPRLDRAGYPLDPKDQAARRDRLRARVVTTTVVATVVAAPVIALWAAYRGAPHTGEGHDGSSVTATEVDGAGGMDGDPSENGGGPPGDRFGARVPDVSAEVVSVGGARHGDARLTVTARTSGAVTTLTLTAGGGEPVTWSAAADAHWLRLSRTSGTLAAGGSTTVTVTVIRHAQPPGPWRARISLTPSGSAVLIDGYGGTVPTTGGPRPTPPPPP